MAMHKRASLYSRTWLLIVGSLPTVACSSAESSEADMASSTTPSGAVGAPSTANPTPAAPGQQTTNTPSTSTSGRAGSGATPAGPNASQATASAGNAAAPAATPSAGTSASGGAQAEGGASATPGASNPAGGVSQWTMIAYDEAGTHNNTAETILTKDNAGSLAMLWQADMGTNVYGAPLMVGDKIYASASSVRAFDAESGMQLWMAPVRSTGSMAYDDGVLYIYTSTPDMVALDAATGMELWRAVPKNNPGGDGLASPIVAGDNVYIGGSHGADEIAAGPFRGYLAAFNKKSGENVWTQFIAPEGGTGGCLWNSIAVDRAANHIYLATANDHREPASDISDALVGMEYETGTILWKNQRTMGDTWNGGSIGIPNGPPDADFAASPILYETMVNGVLTKAVTSGQKHGAAHAVRADDGMLIWTRQVCTGPNTFDGQMGIFTNGAWSGKYVIYACNDGAGKATMFGFEGGTGDMVWMTPLKGSVWGRMSVANGVGFVGAGTDLVVFDTDTGKIIKEVASMGGTVAGTPTIANGRVGFGEGLSWASGVGGRMLTILKVQ